ncbi:MAG: SRPBCC family protein [Terracidiphilus sp.]
MSDRIEKHIELNAPIARVWQALTDYREFGTWFRVQLEGPFVVGKVARGQITHPGYEHVQWEALIEKMEPERLFSFTWPHAKSLDKATYSPDYSNEPRTLVEFRLQQTATGTLLTLTESGFDRLPADRRDAAFRGNEGGWTQQMKNIENYVAQKS